MIGSPVKLSEVRPGETAVLAEFGTTALHLQLLVMGIGPGTRVIMVRKMPVRGSMYIQAGNRRIVLRYAEADQIQVTVAK